MYEIRGTVYPVLKHTLEKHGKTIETVVRGYHAYMDVWSPSVEDKFALEMDELNIHQQYAVLTKVGWSRCNSEATLLHNSIDRDRIA